MSNAFRRHWSLDPEVDFLNHGSFGACPLPVLEEQRELRERLERQPVQFLVRDLPDLLDAARRRVAAFLGADPEGLAVVPNATSGVNAVLRSLRLEPGDELLTTDHAYAACRNALDFVAANAGARVVAVAIPFPTADPDAARRVLLDAVSSRTRIALVDHVTSPTGFVLPVARIVADLSARGVDTLVDGAHAPGMLPLDLSALGAAWFVGNCHKWLCAPKGAAVLWVREDRRSDVRPLAIGHGATQRRPGRSRFHDEFDWTGTDDPTAFLCVPAAIDFMGALLPGGWPELMQRNHALAVAARRTLLQALDAAAPCPEESLGSLAAVPLPHLAPGDDTNPAAPDPLHIRLIREHGIEVPVYRWPALGRRWLRVSAQIYNEPQQYERLAGLLADGAAGTR